MAKRRRQPGKAQPEPVSSVRMTIPLVVLAIAIGITVLQHGRLPWTCLFARHAQGHDSQYIVFACVSGAQHDPMSTGKVSFYG